MQFEEDEARASDEDPEFTGPVGDDAAVEDEFLVDDDAPILEDEDILVDDDDEEDDLAADL